MRLTGSEREGGREGGRINSNGEERIVGAPVTLASSVSLVVTHNQA